MIMQSERLLVAVLMSVAFGSAPSIGQIPSKETYIDAIVRAQSRHDGVSPERCGGSVSRINGVCPHANIPTRGIVIEVGPTEAIAAADDKIDGPSPLADLRINFKKGSFELDGESRARAKLFAEALSDSRTIGARVEIAGHTDATGNTRINMELSKRRANAVVLFLESRGVSASRLSSHGYGPTHLLYPGEPASPANRRVEARVLL